MLRNLEAPGLTALALLLTFVPVFLPVGGLVLTTFAACPLIILALKYPWFYVGSVLALQGVLLVLFDGLAPLLPFSQQAVIPLAMAYTIRRSCTMSYTIALSVLLPLGVATCLLVLWSMVTQQSPLDIFTRYLEQLFQAVQERVHTLELPEGQSDLATRVETLSRIALTIFPGMLTLNYLFTNVLNYLLVRHYCRQSRPPLFLDPVELTAWSAPDHLVWVFLASGVTLLLPWPFLNAVGGNILLVTLAIYLLQGIAITLFWGRRLPLPLPMRWFLAIFVFLLAGPLCLLICTTVGLFDLWVDFRRQRPSRLVP